MPTPHMEFTNKYKKNSSRQAEDIFNFLYWMYFIAKFVCKKWFYFYGYAETISLVKNVSNP